MERSATRTETNGWASVELFLPSVVVAMDRCLTCLRIRSVVLSRRTDASLQAIAPHEHPDDGSMDSNRALREVGATGGEVAGRLILTREEALIGTDHPA
jgi:hypothetical protein